MELDSKEDDIKIARLLSATVPEALERFNHFKKIRKWFEPRSDIPWLKKIIWVIGVLRKTVVSDWHFDNLCGSHLQSQVVVLVSWKFNWNPGERFDLSVDRVAVGKCVVWLAVKTCVEIGYANRWVVKWIITTRQTERKRATKKGDLNNTIAEHHLKTSHAIDWALLRV